MQRSFTMLAVGVVVAALLAVGFATAWYERPTHLTVAIARTDADDTALVATAAKLLKFGKNAVRLRIQSVEGPAAAAAAVDAGKADLAVIRTDLALPDDAQTVVILHRDAALLSAPGGGEVKEVADLAGHKLGIVHRGPGIEAILATALAQYDIRPETVTLVGLAPEDVADAVRSKSVDAVLAVDVLSSPHLRDIVKAVAAGGEGAPVLLPIAEADAIAQRSPGYEKLEVVRGAFGGMPPRPAEEYDTLSITHRLVANENVSQDLISDLTRFFLTEKMQIAASVPIARRIEAPSTDKGLTLPAHAGSAAYIDDDEQTFFDKYSDFIYIGAMLLGVVASGATAVVGRIQSRRTASLETGVGRLIEMLGQVRRASSDQALDALQAEADILMAEALQAASSAGGDDRRLTVFGLALDQMRAAVRDRRVQLSSDRGLAGAILARAAE